MREIFNYDWIHERRSRAPCYESPLSGDGSDRGSRAVRLRNARPAFGSARRNVLLLRVIVGFDALEALLAADTERGNFCFGYSPTLADVYLIPQVEGARRFKVDILRWPNICAIDAAFSQLDSFRLAAPNQQPDAMA